MQAFELGADTMSETFRLEELVVRVEACSSEYAGKRTRAVGHAYHDNSRILHEQAE